MKRQTAAESQGIMGERIVSQKVLLLICLFVLALLCVWTSLHYAPLIVQQAGASLISVGSAPALYVRAVNDQLVLEGRMPSETIRASLMTRAEDVVGPDRVIAKIQVNRRLEQPDWLVAVPAILTDVLSHINAPSLLISEYGVTISGQAPSHQVKHQVIQRAASLLGSGMNVYDRIVVVEQ
ncbi:MAG: hypothetical protein RMM98_15865 [Acidobacteriota bacterium]|nr:hypothetical protein [Blastocatellia bacterium]MDW8241079.1 hypothetical protein [Acidobacteriota bacterium]